ncbi:MAG: pyruvate carboxylase subunit B [Betaproteobacteria bacterium]|nr:pyruvate carboxylase subunit B [Betaproteobacteria bacterium]
MKEIRIIDQTFRDAHQCLWASRMRTGMMLPVAEQMDRIGFESIDLAGGVHFDVGVRYLKENPWEKIRLMCRKVKQTPMICTVRSTGGIGFNVVPNDIQLLWIERLIANGMRIFRVFDPLLDLDNNIYQLNYAKELGAYTTGVLAYGHSPVHTDELYAAKAKELVKRAKIDSFMLKDAPGLLTPDRVKTLIPAIKKALGKIPLELHTHCTTGLGPMTVLEGVKAGADRVHTSIAPLANGAAQPATQTIVRNLRAMGYAVNVNDSLVDEVSEHFRKVAEQEGKPVGVPAEYDAFHYEHQVPGGMISNFQAQLAQAGLSHKLPEVLHECARVRSELGWPIMITPFSQFVGTLAVLNVVNGERYRVIPDEIKKYALGYNGKLLAPIEPNVLDKIITNGSQSIALKPPAPEPGVPALRKKYPGMSDEERLLRHAYAGTQVDDMFAAGPIKTDYEFEAPLVRLLEEVLKQPKRARICIESKMFNLEMRTLSGSDA